MANIYTSTSAIDEAIRSFSERKSTFLDEDYEFYKTFTTFLKIILSGDFDALEDVVFYVDPNCLTRQAEAKLVNEALKVITTYNPETQLLKLIFELQQVRNKCARRMDISKIEELLGKSLPISVSILDGPNFFCAALIDYFGSETSLDEKIDMINVYRLEDPDNLLTNTPNEV